MFLIWPNPSVCARECTRTRLWPWPECSDSPWLLVSRPVLLSRKLPLPEIWPDIRQQSPSEPTSTWRHIQQASIRVQCFLLLRRVLPNPCGSKRGMCPSGCFQHHGQRVGGGGSRAPSLWPICMWICWGSHWDWWSPSPSAFSNSSSYELYYRGAGA